MSNAALIAAVHRIPSMTFSVMTTIIREHLLDHGPNNITAASLIALGVQAERAYAVVTDLQHLDLETTTAELRRYHIHVVTINDTEYPFLLKQISSAPPVLYIRGSIEALHRTGLAVVGTRRPSPYGTSILPTLLQPVLRAGVIVVSGLALGIDGQAHRLAVQHHSPTVAVLGCGVDTIYPREHRQLSDDILATGGAIISEFPLNAEPERHHFPQRNRIISGLTTATLLVEAGEKSGALITAKFAVDQNRDVLSVPGPITSPQSVGPLNWLKLGATPITSADDILRVFGATTVEPSPTPTVYQPQNDIERNLLGVLAHGPVHIDELAEKSRLDNSVVSATLTLLEISGVVRHHGGHLYSL
jgi:DNA processing protein